MSYVLLNKYYFGDQFKMNKMGRICSFYGGEERGTYRVVVEKSKGQNHFEDLGVDRWIILKWIFRRWDRDE